MKNDNVKRIDPFTGIGAMLGMMTDQSFRDDVFRTEEKGFIVDTACPPDIGEWETGVQVGEESFIVVEQYESREAAEKGHQKWVESMTNDPAQKLTDIQVWEGL